MMQMVTAGMSPDGWWILSAGWLLIAALSAAGGYWAGRRARRGKGDRWS